MFDKFVQDDVYLTSARPPAPAGHRGVLRVEGPFTGYHESRWYMPGGKSVRWRVRLSGGAVAELHRRGLPPVVAAGPVVTTLIAGAGRHEALKLVVSGAGDGVVELLERR